MVIPVSEIKRILVGIDGSGNAIRAAEFAAGMASKYGATVTLLFVVAPSEHAMISGKVILPDESDKGFGEQRLMKAEEVMAKANVTFDKDIEFGHPADRILNVSEKGYDIIVLGTRGLSAVRGFLMGSVSNQVSQHSKVPVVVVP